MDDVTLPIGKAADQLLASGQPLAAIVVLQAAAIIALCVWIVILTRSGRADLAKKDKELAEKDVQLQRANELRVEDLKTLLPAIRDLKDMAIDLAVSSKGRLVK